MGDWEATKLILNPLVNLDYLNHSRLFILAAFLVSTLLIQSVFGPKFKKNHLLELLVLGPILYLSPLMVGFVVYFGFWHALPSMMTEYKFLRSFEAYSSIKKFTYQLLPFSLISFIGIGLILFFWLGVSRRIQLDFTFLRDDFPDIISTYPVYGSLSEKTSSKLTGTQHDQVTGR
ncbi:Brp/Blh family beta-carotene 15,15'-dioxygenase [Algoriphagus boritolerans]|uniref:Brp/Blh family beta-carotene 15,15'-dioxygenase n=1 Tax=Algoriphagus boritolerans TaxID=308111 RepID=UPI000A9DA7F8